MHCRSSTSVLPDVQVSFASTSQQLEVSRPAIDQFRFPAGPDLLHEYLIPPGSGANLSFRILGSLHAFLLDDQVHNSSPTIDQRLQILQHLFSSPTTLSILSNFTSTPATPAATLKYFTILNLPQFFPSDPYQCSSHATRTSAPAERYLNPSLRILHQETWTLGAPPPIDRGTRISRSRPPPSPGTR